MELNIKTWLDIGLESIVGSGYDARQLDVVDVVGIRDANDPADNFIQRIMEMRIMTRI